MLAGVVPNPNIFDSIASGFQCKDRRGRGAQVFPRGCVAPRSGHNKQDAGGRLPALDEDHCTQVGTFLPLWFHVLARNVLGVLCRRLLVGSQKFTHACTHARSPFLTVSLSSLTFSPLCLSLYLSLSSCARKHDSANGIYYFIDMIELLSIFEILPYKPAAIKKIRYRVWTLKVVFSLCLIILAIHKNKKALRKERKEGTDDRKLNTLLAGAVYE